MVWLRSKLKFVYKGQRLDGQYTPADLRMKDLDRIDCVVSHMLVNVVWCIYIYMSACV